MWILKLNGFRHRYVHSIKLRRLKWYFDYLFFGSLAAGGGLLTDIPDKEIGCENEVLMQYNASLVSFNSGALALVSWSENLTFKHPAYFGGKSHSHPDFKREKNSNKAESFFGLKLMSALTWNTEKELEREISK